MPPTTALPDSARDYLLFVYVGKESCPICRREDVRSAVRSSRFSVQQQAETAGLSYHSIGISLDANPQAAMTHLREIGPFHEFLAGGNWIGIGAEYFLWSRFGPPIATPQVLVIKRKIRVSRIPPITRDYLLSDSDLLVRKVGMTEVRSWASVGATVPGIGNGTEFLPLQGVRNVND